MPPITIPSITGGQVERLAPGDRFTLAVQSGQTVTGGRLVELTADNECKMAAANSAKVVGVALHDADPAGEWKKVSVAAEGVWNLTAVGAINAGDPLAAAANGQVALHTPAAAAYTQYIGIAMAAIANGAQGPVKLRL
jgi:hypothetical protein